MRWEWKRHALWGVCTTCSLVLCTDPSVAEGDSVKGRTLAEEWCSRCHDIAPEGAFKKQPPSFAAIAVYRSAGQIHSRISTPTVHFGMPRFARILEPGRIDDLVAYIVSLEAPQ